MCSALGVKNIITEAEDILMKLVRVLERRLDRDPFRLSLEIHNIVQHFVILIEIAHKAFDSLRFMVNDMLRLLAPAVLIDDRQFRIQICRLMHTALDLILLKARLLENLRVRQEVHLRSRLFRLAKLREQPVLKRYDRNTPLIAVMMDIPLPADLHIHIC